METAPGKTGGNGPNGNRGNDPRGVQVGAIPGGNMEKRPRGERGIDSSGNGGNGPRENGGKFLRGKQMERSQGRISGMDGLILFT
jgi:hypothetical protein